MAFPALVVRVAFHQLDLRSRFSFRILQFSVRRVHRQSSVGHAGVEVDTVQVAENWFHGGTIPEAIPVDETAIAVNFNCDDIVQFQRGHIIDVQSCEL